MAAAVHLRKVAVRDGETAEGALANLRRLAAIQRSRWVHPTQLYDAIGLSILFALLSVIFYRRQRHGLVVAWTMVLYSVSRFLMETIRGDNPHDVAGLTVSQFISLVVFVAGLVYIWVLVRKGKGDILLFVRESSSRPGKVECPLSLSYEGFRAEPATCPCGRDADYDTIQLGALGTGHLGSVP